MDNYRELYLKLKEEFETYQSFAESTIQILNEKNTKLEKKLDALVNLVEIGKYINLNVSDGDLIPMINDMIIGILGVTYSSIYIKENDLLKVKATNVDKMYANLTEDECFNFLKDEKPFIINSKKPLFGRLNGKANVHSLIGVPITLRENLIGYIVVEHTLYDFFNYEHITFISSIANQIGIALENSFLYHKVRENSIRDPLLGIYNRKYFFDVVENKIARKRERSFAIIMVDIDDFKKVNDRFGHQFGDEVLIQTVDIISESLGARDIIARYGGEEIVLYIHKVISPTEVYKKIDRIRQRISENKVIYNNLESYITASFGISFYPQTSVNLQQLLNAADNMLYKAKGCGKNIVISA